MKRHILILVAAVFICQNCQGNIQETADHVMNENQLPTSIESIQQKSLKNQEKSPLFDSQQGVGNQMNFRYAARKVTPGVVHVISKYEPTAKDNEAKELPNPFRDFFGDEFWDRYFDRPFQGQQPTRSSGSGIIISDDGYILTNNHVVDEADELEIVLHDRRSFVGEVIGNDPSTDLALIKIKAKALSFIQFGNSDQVEVGDWVLAVGNPFNLSSTVTAGIVSAKARNINILRDQAAIESFIQTDAALNPGNSGGALVNLNGDLIGINSAIATPTGTYAGYSFAIPVNIAKKIVNDLINYGEVRRGYLGIIIRDMNGKIADELGIDQTTGVYVDSVVANGAAQEAGIRSGDVIINLNDQVITAAPRLQELIASQRPGDKINLVILRNGNKKMIEAILKNIEETSGPEAKAKSDILDVLGITLKALTGREKSKLKIAGGLKVVSVKAGKIKSHTNMEKGFIITKVDKKPVSSIKEFLNIMQSIKGGIMLEGIYPNDPGTVFYYGFGL